MTDCNSCQHRYNLDGDCRVPALAEMYREHGDLWTCAFYESRIEEDDGEAPMVE